MKKFLFLAFALLLLMPIFIKASPLSSKEKVIIYKDMTTKNFVKNTKNLDLTTVKKICTYEFCDFVVDTTKESMINTFTNNYIKSLNNDELRAELKIKGIRITKVILK